MLIWLQDKKRLFNIFLFCSALAVLSCLFFNDMQYKIKLLSNGQAAQTRQMPYYGFLPVPGTAANGQGYGALGADFAQVYFSSLALQHGQNEYNPQNPAYRDPLGRRPNYPPFTNRLLSPLTRLPYYQALITHDIATFALLITTSGLVLWFSGLGSYIWQIIFVDILLYFYTPLGFAHLERGQFDLLSAVCYLLLIYNILCHKRGAWLYSSGAGILAAIKWSALPFLGTFCLAALCAARKKERIYHILPLLVVAASILFYLPELKEYWPSLQRYEVQARPTGISFMLLMPAWAAKSLQIASAILIIILIKFKSGAGKEGAAELFRAISLPFAAAMFIQGMCFGTISYEYRIVGLLGIIPGLAIWLDRYGSKIGTISAALTVAGFTAFTISAFRVFYFQFWPIPVFTSPVMAATYLTFSIFFILISIMIIFQYGNFSPEIQATE
ncbi:hypothetical protein MNBD_DELTA03-240 [hydrothermal vent metagenome]|uniref:Glycosyltransferase RgtA/B/C/D-like domain-containing protein n=1 Tax=hydrothermal vent metagenome TaxID=652676 RepID=A0A3B0V9J4_9ZZZZ